MNTVADREDTGCYEPAYWLAHCEGFRVEGPTGRLGVVESVRRTADGSPDALVVAGGMTGTRRWLVPASAIAVVQPRRERVALTETARELTALPGGFATRPS